MHADNLYLDMNGIIHNCTHANSDTVVRFSEKDMMLSVFAYIDKLFAYIKPRKVFFMALDGIVRRSRLCVTTSNPLCAQGARLGRR